MCVETLTWVFVPAQYETDEYTMGLTFDSADMPSHKWSADVKILIEEADVLADVGFGANMATFADRKCKHPEDKFKLGQRFWAKIQLENVVVNAKSITCETFKIHQTKDGDIDTTDMMETKYKFQETTDDEDAVNEHACSAELEATHFHKSVDGYDTLLETNIKIEYVQGHTQTRRLLLNVPQGMMQNQYDMNEFSVGESYLDMKDEMYRNSKREPDTDNLKLGLTLLDTDISDAFQTLQTADNSNILNYASYIFSVTAILVFGYMITQSYCQSQKKADSDFRLLTEEDIE